MLEYLFGRIMEKLLDRKDVERFNDMIDNAKRIVLTCHVRPDGDAIGSTLGLSALFRKLGKETCVVVPDMPPKTLSFLPGFNDIAIYSKYDPYCTRVVNDSDLIVCCDFNKPSRQDHLENLIQSAEVPKILIDHHLSPDDFADLIFSMPDMSSACELSFRIIAAAGLYDLVDRNVATCLLTGMVTDTRNFSVNCKHSDIYEILTHLMEKGANKEEIVKLALMITSYWSVRLQAYAVYEKLEIFENSHAAVITLDKNELAKFHYERGDSEGLVNRPLDIRGVVYSFFLREDEDCIKVSARSCLGFPVNKICEDLYGGGGHLQASGGEFLGTLEECRRILVDSMPLYDKYLPKKMDRIDCK